MPPSSAEQILFEMDPPNTDNSNNDYEEQLRAAQTQLERLQAQREELERQRVQAEERNNKKQAFLQGQADLEEKFSHSLGAIEREVLEIREELNSLEQTKERFVKNMEHLSRYQIEDWSSHQLGEELDRALQALENAENDYNEAARHLSHGRSKGVLNGVSGKILASGASFRENVFNGLAFNLPIILLALICLLIYLAK